MKAAREKLGISRRELAEKIGVDPRYLANIELKATIPSILPYSLELRIAPSGIVVNTQSRKGQRMLGIPDIIHLHHLTTRVCGFPPEAPA